MRYFYSLIIGLLILVGCSKPVTLQFNGKDYYYTTNGVQVAFDGKDWFQMRHPEVDAGFQNGQQLGQGEEWIKLTGDRAGSHISTWHRNLATFNNTNIPPVFVQY